MSRDELNRIIDSLEDALEGEDLERAKIFAQTLIAYRQQGLDKFREEEMAGKMSQTSEYIFYAGFETGINAYEHALERSNPEIIEELRHVKEKIERSSSDVKNRSGE